MTGMPMRLTILTPEGACFDETVTSVVAPGAKGYFGVLPGHAPMVAALEPGVLTANTESDAAFFVISEGVADVAPAVMTVLVRRAAQAADMSSAQESVEQMKTEKGLS